MKKEWLVKTFALGVIVLFISSGIVSAFNIDNKPDPLNNGNWLYVGGDGPGNYTKIQDAIDNASDGDTVFVYDDSSPYYENILINKSINLIGEDNETTIIDGKNSGDTINVIADNTTISKLNIQNSSNPLWDSGIHIWSNYTNIIDNIITLNHGGGIHFEETSYYNLVSNNIISYNDRDGIKVDKRASKNDLIPDNNTFINNLITRNKWSGISFHKSCFNNITENIISYNNYRGIEISFRGDNFVSKNKIIFNNRGFGLFESPRNIVYKNDIFNNANTGFRFSHKSEYNEIFCNNISNNLNGMEIDYSNNNLISDNIFSYNQNNGIYLTDCENGNIFENEFIKNKIGVYVGESCKNNLFSDNNFSNDGFFIKSKSNSYVNNKINGKPIWYYEDESDKNIGGISSQVILLGCSNITIGNMELSNTAVGIELEGCNNCVIKSNKITNNNYFGIYIKGSNNIISRNHIVKNRIGLFWIGIKNIVKENNFILNKRDVGFHMEVGGGITTEWRRNYWDRPRILPKLVLGFKEIIIYEYYYGYVTIPIIWFGVDIFPAKIPHII